MLVTSVFTALGFQPGRKQRRKQRKKKEGKAGSFFKKSCSLLTEREAMNGFDCGERERKIFSFSLSPLSLDFLAAKPVSDSSLLQEKKHIESRLGIKVFPWQGARVREKTDIEPTPTSANSKSKGPAFYALLTNTKWISC